MTKPVIECRPDGPFVVKGLAELRNSRGDNLPVRPVMALCRCGGSANKPFCDGTHAKIGFSGARLGGGPKDKRRDYVGKRITIHDNRALCSHSAHCTDGLAAVFSSERRPWIDPNGAAAEEIIEVVGRCPSGALSYSIDGVEHRDHERAAAITVTKDGPYAVTGGAELAGVAMGEGASTEHFTLCRCGASKNKPFCDGSHWDAQFKDEKN
ncbi:MAG: CDGSH iron-sulfur domain-containing protein [Hyphomicrobiales bacterium]